MFAGGSHHQLRTSAGFTMHVIIIPKFLSMRIVSGSAREQRMGFARRGCSMIVGSSGDGPSSSDGGQISSGSMSAASALLRFSASTCSANRGPTPHVGVDL